MSYVIFVIISMSFVFSACNGTMNDLSVGAHLLQGCRDAVHFAMWYNLSVERHYECRR